MVSGGEDTRVSDLPVGHIVPNQRQPRRHFDEDALEELADSIRVHGILQPILVRPIGGNKYELIAGERRWRASQIAGLKQVPAIIKSAAGQESLELAIIENVQREDISAFESALAYRMLSDEFGLNQEEIAIRVGKTRSAISNTLRLLKLPEEILQGLQEGVISEGHARALLALPTAEKQLAIYELILIKGLSVREVERLCKQPDEAPKAPKRAEQKDAYTKQLETALSERTALPTKLSRDGDKGKLTIEFFSDDDLQRILDLLGIQL
jgi:ParB family chromosome partitioning protein